MQTLLASAAVIAAGASGAAAQEGGSEAGGADIRILSLDAISIYATLEALPAFDYPGQVSVIDRERIDDLAPSSVADVFQAIPGASMQGGPRRTGESPSIRGLSGSGVLVLFDGARQSFVSGHDGRFFIDPELLEAVEVVRGPSSALYGSGALGGVVALRTIDAADFLAPGETMGVKLSGGYQSVNEEWRTTGTGFWRSEARGLDAVASLTYREGDDIELGSGEDLPAEDEILSALIKGSAALSEAVTLGLSWIHYADDARDPSNPQGNNLAGATNALVDRAIRGDTVQASLDIAPADSRLIDLGLVAYYTRNEVEEDEVDSVRTLSREVETLGLSFDNRSHISLGEGAELTLTIGAEGYGDEQVGEDNTTADGSREGVPDAEAHFYGAFAQVELAFDKPLGLPGTLDIIPGVRWDKFENEADGEQDTDDDAVSPKIGVAYKPVPWMLVFGNWAEAFRAPSFNELYADGVHFQLSPSVANVFVANPDLEPEESETWEAGLGFDFHGVVRSADQLSVKGSYWESDVDNLIDLEVDMSGCFGPFGTCTSRYVNTPQAELEGIEIEAAYGSDLLYARATFETIDGEDAETGEHVGILYPTRVWLDTGVFVPRTDVRVGTRITWADEFDEVDDPAEERDGYTVGDLYLVWEPATGPAKGLRLDLGVDNLSDEDYEVVAAGASEPGRNYKLGLSWRTAW